MEYLQTKIKYTKQLENGSFKRVCELILVKAVTFGECEIKTLTEIGKIHRRQVSIIDMVKKSFVDLFVDELATDPYYYLVKVKESVLDADSSKEKTVKNTYLVFADNVKKAHALLTDTLDPQMVNYKIIGVDESKITDILD